MMKDFNQPIKQCEHHGVDMVLVKRAYLDPYFECPECNRERDTAIRKQEQERENRERQYRIEKNFEQCQIGPRFKAANFSNYKPQSPEAKKVLDTCAEYAFDFGKIEGASLIFLGTPGTGKNHLAAAICNQIIKDGHTALHTTVMKMLRRVKSTWARDAEETEQKAILSFSQPDLLVIDEVGVQFGSDTEKLLLTEIINDRYERIKSTILISNLAIPQLKDVLGDRVIDRFRDGGSVLSFKWESYRRSKC